MRFHFVSTLTIRIFLWIIAALSLIGLVVGILAFAGVHIEITTAQSTILVSMCSLTLLVSLLFGTIHYKVDDAYLHLNIAFIDMLSNRIRLDKILNIVIENNVFYISYLWKGPDPVIAAIMISPKRYDDFKTLLMSRNPNIVFYEANNEKSTDSK